MRRLLELPIEKRGARARPVLWLAAWLVLACFGPSLAAAQPLQISVAPAVGTAFGTTDFELAFRGRDQNGESVEGRSVLAWPVDFVLLGFDGALAIPLRNDDALVVQAHLMTNAGDARGSMRDSDYVGSKSQDIPQTRFAFTKSDTTSTAFYGELSVGYQFRRLRGITSLTPFVGYRHEHYLLRALGARGTYPDDMGDPQKVAIPDYLVGAEYTAEHALPFVGAAFEPVPLGPVHLPVRVRAFYVYDHSEDDHPLRGKDAVGHTHGAGFSVGMFPKVALSPHVAVGAGAELFYLKGFRGVLHQSFYRDDPDTAADERTQAIPDSDFYVRSIRTQLTLFVELAI